MSTYDVPDLLQKWKRAELTAEQALGHVLQHLLALAQKMADIEKRQQLLEQQLNRKP